MIAVDVLDPRPAEACLRALARRPKAARFSIVQPLPPNTAVDVVAVEGRIGDVAGRPNPTPRRNAVGELPVPGGTRLPADRHNRTETVLQTPDGPGGTACP